ncbi:outer membrane protein assembly factor BamD [Marinobacter sp.]|uniref:outer membrane protein assembly factor BamD n=1 Tax=Marinobacter sp. TaxID=50741 RepID=UPI0035C6FD3A
MSAWPRNLPFAAFMGLVLVTGATTAQESFRVELGGEGETLGDMRPVFLPFESRPLPAISPSEVARRYQRLFQSSDEPEVRIDALNRLGNIRDRSGEDVGFSPAEEEQAYREAIASYEAILERGAYAGRLDELLYQMAKAHALTGQAEASIQRLKQLVGLYPDSPLVPEARFRLAEHAFAAGDYARAETAYRQLLESGKAGELGTKARYMLGWSQFKQGSAAWDRAAGTFVTVLDEFLPDSASLSTVAEANIDTIDDTFRVLALMASRKQGPESLVTWLEAAEHPAWEHLLFDRLADYYAVRGETLASVETHEAFFDWAPAHRSEPAFRLQLVEVWRAAGDPDRARRARAEFVAQYRPLEAYSALGGEHQSRWQEFSRELADHAYARGSRFLKEEQDERARDEFRMAAGFYEGLAERVNHAGEVLRLAGDARLQAGQYPLALADFRQAAYEQTGFAEAADAGWAGIVLLRDGVDGRKTDTAFAPGLSELTGEADRFLSRFPDDRRGIGLMADLAARWLSVGDQTLALDYSARVIGSSGASSDERFAAWQVTARIRQQNREYGLAERAWNQALKLAESEGVSARVSGQTEDLRQQLATVVYRQGEQAAAAGRVEEAVRHFQRVEPILPGSEIAVKARFDAANTLLKAEAWGPAVANLEEFRRAFPNHGLADGISEKLVLAWTESGDYTRAASELLQASANQADPWPYRLRAAELLDRAGNLVERNQLYRDYLAAHPTPGDGQQHQQLQTLRYQLMESTEDADHWREALVAAELDSPWHSDASLEWAARASLVLGARAAAAFTRIGLDHPLEQSLAHKQAALETARQRFLDAEALGGEQVLSESLFRRAELYRGLANDLMASSVPAELNEMEAMQYQMLLEEEAYPFEEKAIGLHRENHQRITSSGYDPWIGRSLSILAELHPGRYERNLKWLSWNMEVADGA